MKLRFTPRALRQFNAIADYISRENPEAAARVGARIRAACEILCRLPLVGREGVRAGTRELSTARLPYVIVYRIGDGEIVILGIYHSAQLRPGQSGL